jgi:hypothetical protein
MQMIGAFDVAPLRHYKNMSVRADYLNLGAIKPRQYGSGNDFVDGTECCAASAQVKHAVKDAQKLIELMRAEQDGNSPLTAKSPDKINHTTERIPSNTLLNLLEVGPDPVIRHENFANGSVTRREPTLEDMANASATRQCAPVLVKVRSELTTSADRRPRLQERSQARRMIRWRQRSPTCDL